MDKTPDHEDNVGLPLDVVKSDGESELVDESTAGNEQVGESHSLGTHLEGEDLDGVESLKWGPSERVDSLENVDHSNSGSTCCLVTQGSVPDTTSIFDLLSLSNFWCNDR